MWPVMSKIFPDADRTPRHDLTDHCDGPADLNPGTLVLGGADGCIMFAAQGLLDWPGEERRCPRGDLNPHALIRALAPQASASANSATRTSAEGTLATGRPDPHIGSGWLDRADAGPPGVRMGAMAEDLEHAAYDPSYDPTGEVVDICRDLIRMDTSNYGDDSGPGERKAAEHVAALLDEVGIESQLYESEPGRTSVVAQWGRNAGGENALLLHGHLDVVPAVAEDWQVDPFAGEIRDDYLWGRGAVDMKNFDAMLLSVVRARTRAGAVPERPVVLCFTADEEAGGHHGAQVLVEEHRDHLEHCTEAVGEVGGFSTTIRGQRLYLIEAAEKGMAWMKLTARGRAGHGSMINHDNAVTRLSAAVARIGAHDWPVRLTPTMQIDR